MDQLTSVTVLVGLLHFWGGFLQCTFKDFHIVGVAFGDCNVKGMSSAATTCMVTASLRECPATPW